jgi:hypothetical protein
MTRWPLAVAMFLAAVAQAEMPLTDAKVYVGTDGVRAVVALRKPLSEDTCLIELSGRASDLDDLVLPCRIVRTEGQRTEQSTYYVDARLRARAELTAPGDGSATSRGRISQFRLTYDAAASKAVNLEAMWKRHQSQRADGSIGRLLDFDRASEVETDAKAFKASLELVNRGCGSHLSGKIDWSQAPDPLYVSRGARSDCEVLLGVLGQLCEGWKVARTTISAKVTAVECTFVKGASSAVTLKGSRLVMVSGEENDLNLDGVITSLEDSL